MNKIIICSILIFVGVALASGFEISQQISANVLQKNIAYIYKSKGKIDQNIVDILDENYNITFIQERSLPDNFNKFKFVYIGNERYRNYRNIHIEEFPAIIVNHLHGNDWGMTDRNGVSQMGASRPLKVVMNGDIVQVYDRAFKRGRSAVPYYYLNQNSKSEAMNQIWGTQTTSSGKKFGDVISYSEVGSELENSKITNGNICFFGIASSKFWTEEANDLFRDCIKFVEG